MKVTPPFCERKREGEKYKGKPKSMTPHNNADAKCEYGKFRNWIQALLCLVLCHILYDNLPMKFQRTELNCIYIAIIMIPWDWKINIICRKMEKTGPSIVWKFLIKYSSLRTERWRRKDLLYVVVGPGCCLLYFSTALKSTHFLAGFLLRLPNTVLISQVVVEAGVVL